MGVPTLKTSMADDAAAFLNTDEFAEEIEWNGASQWYDRAAGAFKPIIAVIESEDADKADPEGLFRQSKTVFILADSIDLPVPGEQVTLNGERYLVKATEAMGALLEIDLNFLEP